MTGTRSATPIRVTTLDGTPCDATEIRKRLAELAAAFNRAGADLGLTERALLKSLGPQLRRAVRAFTRFHQFERALREWRVAAKQQRAARAASRDHRIQPFPTSLLRSRQARSLRVGPHRIATRA